MVRKIATDIISTPGVGCADGSTAAFPIGNTFVAVHKASRIATYSFTLYGGVHTGVACYMQNHLPPYFELVGLI